MSLIAPDAIFRGITSSGARKSLKRILDGRADSLSKYVIPCVGQFTVPEALVSGGVDPSRIQASDITLFSSTLGYLADPQKSVTGLGFEVLSDECKQLLDGLSCETETQLAAQIMMVIKWSQMYSQKEYVVWQKREYMSQRIQIFEKYLSSLDQYAQKMGGMRYDIRDAFVVIDEVENDSKAFVWFNPPGYSKGYSKMFNPRGHYVWKAPDILELSPKKVEKYVEKLLTCPALICLYATEGHVFKQTPEGWFKHYTEVNEETKRRTYVMVNQKVEAGVLNRRKFCRPPKRLWPIFDDHEITKDSIISLVKTDRDTAMYYYDLFVRELGVVSTEVFYLFCVDGQVAGVCGFHHSHWMRNRTPILYETFGLSITCERYARIGRLLMMSITCQEFLDEIVSKVDPRLMLTKLTKLQTVCLTKYPEAKKNRGILKLIHREQMPNGRYHLVYKTSIWQRGYKECLDVWLAKHAKYRRK